MDRQILLLAANMLDLASEVFSNHGCNDLDDKDLDGMTDETKLCDDIRKWNGDNECEWPKKANYIGNSTLMSYLSDKLKEEANTDNKYN